MGCAASDTAELSFTEVEVPEENLLGSENQGFRLIMANFAWERLLMAVGAVGGVQRGGRRRGVGAVGGMQGVIETTISYAKERQAFGRPIGKFQAIRHKIAEMATKTEAAKQLTYATAWRFANGEHP